MPNLMFGICVADERDLEVPGAHQADVAGAEALGEGFAVLRAGVLMDVAGLRHVAEPLKHLRELIADQRLVAGADRLDLDAARPKAAGRP